MAGIGSYNRQVIAAFRAGRGVVGGELQGQPLLLLSTSERSQAPNE